MGFYTQWALDKFEQKGVTPVSTVTAWNLEEERRRRERLGIPSESDKPASGVALGREEIVRRKPVAQESRVYFEQQAKSAKAVLSEYESPDRAIGPMEEYLKLENTIGTEQLRDRISAINNIWNTFLPTVDGKEAIWQLVKSPYDLQTIHAMAREGALSKYAKDKNQTRAYEKLSLDWFGHDRMMAKHYLVYGDQTVPATERLTAFATQNPIEALMLAATAIGPAGGAVPGILGKIMLGAGMLGGVGTAMAQSGSISAGTKAERARSQPLLFDTSVDDEPDYLKTLMIRPFLRDDDPLAQEFDQLRAINSVVYESKLDDTDIDALKQWLTTALVDPYTGEIILPAEDIEDLDKGYITYEVANALLSRAAKVRNQEFDFKVELLERGFQVATSPDFSLPLASEEWKPAVDKYNQHMIEEARAWEIYPVEAAFRDERGYEWTAAGKAAANEALLSMGLVNVPYEYAFKLITDFGGVQEALGARAEFVTRANRDEAYQRKEAAFRDYIMENYMVEGGRYSGYDPWEPSHVNQVTDLVRLDLMEQKGDVGEDEELVRLNAELAQEEMRLIKGDEGYWGKDYVGTMAQLIGADAKGWMKLRQEHPQVIAMTNLFADMSGAFATPPLWRAMRGGSVGGKVPDFLQDGRVTARLGRAAKYIDEGNLQGAATVLGDTQAAQQIVMSTHKWMTAIDNPKAYTGMADEIFKLAEKGDVDAVAKLLVGERAPEVAARIVDYVRTKGTSERSLVYFEKQVQPGTDAFGGAQRLTVKAQAVLDAADHGGALPGVTKLRAIAKENSIKVAKGAKADDIVLLMKNRQAELRNLAEESPVPQHMPFRESGPGVGVGFISDAQRKPLLKKSEAGTQWGPVPMPSGVALQEMSVKGKITQWLANEQAKHGTVFGTKPAAEALKIQAAYAWTMGKNIMPELRFSQMGERLYVKTAIDSAIAKIKNDYLRKTLTDMVKWYHREPQDVVDLTTPEALEIVHDWVLVATGDARVARDMAAEAMRIKGPQAARAFEVKLVKTANEYLERRKVAPTLTKTAPGAESAMGLKPAVESTGKVMEYKTRTGETAQVPVDTSMSKYTINLGKDIMWAPYRMGTVDDTASLVVQGLQRTRNVTRKFRNGMRAVTRFAYTVNAPLRNTAVGAGSAVLLTKHAVADTPRSALSGVPVINFQAVRKRFNAYLEKMSTEAAEYVRYMRHRSEYTGQHYLTAVDSKWNESVLFDSARNPTKQINEAADSLRRVGQGKVFRAWAKGGPEAAKKWYMSAQGKAWMHEEGYYRAFRAEYSGPGLKGRALDEAVADWATQKYVFGYLEEMRAAAPHLLDGYDDVAGLIKLAESGQMAPGNIKQLIEAVGKREPSENMRLGVQMDVGAGGNIVNQATKPFIWGIKKAMIPDRFNRVTVFDHTFNRLYSRMVKEGVDPEQAARTASEVAYVRSEQVHFDMSRALEWETKYRGFAWFLADSRIYAQYWLQAIAERPTLAMAVKDFQNWMEERSSNLEIPEWQKYNITIPVGNGNYLTCDPTIYFWFTVYSQESLMGHGVERATLGVANKVLGTGIKPAPMDFGMNVTRFDEIAKAMFHVADSPLGVRGFVPFKDVADWNIPESEWQAWLERQSSGYREKVARETHKRMALAEINEKPITWSEAMAQTLVSNLARQSYRFLRPSSTRVITAAELEYNTLMRQLKEAKTPEAKEEIIEANPALLYTMGMSTDPWTKEELDEYRNLYFAAQDRLAAELDRLFDENRIMDKDAVDAAYKEFETTRESLKAESEVFRDWMTASKTEDLEAAIGYLMPGTDAEFFLSRNEAPSPKMIADMEKVTEEWFQESLKEYGVLPSETNDPLYKLLKDFYIRQHREWTLGPQDESTRREKSVARYLSRGGEAGPFREDKYLTMVRDKRMRELLGKGVSQGKASADNPMFLGMSTSEKEAMGWNADPKAETGWWEWAVKRHEYTKYIAEFIPGGKNTSAGKAVWAEFEAWEKKHAEHNPGWAAEMEFTQKPLHIRLREFGVGTGDGAESQGWRGFLDMVSDFHDERMAIWNVSTKEYGVGPTAKSTDEIVRRYTRKLADYVRENEEWWTVFRNTFVLSKFGFVKKLAGEYEDILWWGTDDEGEEEVFGDG